MDDREPTVRSRALGDGLSAALNRRKMNNQQAADELKWSAGKVSRLLAGKRGGDPIDVSAFLAMCKVTGSERDRLMQLSREQDGPGWLQRFGSALPKQVRTLVDHEDLATSIDDFQAQAIPGLLQTADYARALIKRGVNTPPDEAEDRVIARMARQAIFRKEQPAKFTFYIHEFAIRLPVGDAGVMSEQLHLLLRKAVRPHTTIRIVPASVGAHGAISGPFTLMRSPDYRPVIYLDSETSCLFLEDEPEATAYQRILDSLAEVALDAGQSKKWISTIATELYPMGDDHDDGT